MLLFLCLLTAFCYVKCDDSEDFDLRVRYLEDLVTKEVKKAESYQRRNNNQDLLGKAADAKPVDYGSYDFIVIGGGTSGCVVANRLTENPKWKVLLLEAGDINDEFTDMPFTSDTSAASQRNWGYVTEGQRNGCKGRDWGQCPIPQGKILGGSGSINDLYYSRGIREDFNKWSDAGNAGWSWNDVLPYYKKLEKFVSNNADVRYRGTNGPVNVEYAKSKSVPGEAYLQANYEYPIRIVEDYNAFNINGASWAQHNIANGKRVSGATNYIKPALNRTNFKLELRAFATKIVVDPKTREATGVEFIKDDKKYLATASREVILSAEPINSPQLLMLSGIGPKSDLHGTPVIQDLPIGQYMTHQVRFTGLHVSSSYVEPTLSTYELVKKYLKGDPSLRRRGVTHFNSRNWGSPLPNIELSLKAPVPTAIKFPYFENSNSEVRKFESSINASTDWVLQLSLLHPKSTGTVKLKNKNPNDFPKIDPGIFDDPEDLEDLYRAIELALDLLDTPTGKKYNLTLNINLPSCPNSKLKSNPREYWYCLLKLLALPAQQVASTVKMGPASDPLSCVDHKLKIHGVNSLRVVDVSVIPTTVTGDISTLAFLIGEKGADLIKADHV